MRILHITPSYVPAYSYGGPVKAIRDLCVSLVKKGLEIAVFTSNSEWTNKLNVPLNEPTDLDGVKVIYFPVAISKKYCFMPGLFKALWSDLSKFDVVHIHSLFLYPTLMAAYLCRRKKIPYIINPLGALDPAMINIDSRLKKTIYLRLIENYNIRKAAAIHVASSYEKEQILSLGFKGPFAIVPRGIDLKDYEKKPGIKDLKDIHPDLKNKKIILFLGRIHSKKGFDLLAEAFRQARKSQRDISLVIAGPSEEGYIDKAKNLFKAAGISEYVLFMGELLGDEKLAAFYSSDIFVLPSYGENFGIAVLEAMACKLPVIITNRVGLHPDVQEYNAGLVTDCASSEVAGAILKLLDDENLRRSMGANGERLIRDRFTINAAADKMIEVYKRIIDNRTR